MCEGKIDFNVPMGNVGRYSLCIMKLQQNNNEKKLIDYICPSTSEKVHI